MQVYLKDTNVYLQYGEIRFQVEVQTYYNSSVPRILHGSFVILVSSALLRPYVGLQGELTANRVTLYYQWSDVFVYSMEGLDI